MCIRINATRWHCQIFDITCGARDAGKTLWAGKDTWTLTEHAGICFVGLLRVNIQIFLIVGIRYHCINNYCIGCLHIKRCRLICLCFTGLADNVWRHCPDLAAWLRTIFCIWYGSVHRGDCIYFCTLKFKYWETHSVQLLILLQYFGLYWFCLCKELILKLYL